MKSRQILIALALVFAVGSAFVSKASRPFAGPYGIDPHSSPANQCVAGSINQLNCTTGNTGAQCTVTLPDASIVPAFSVMSDEFDCADELKRPHTK